MDIKFHKTVTKDAAKGPGTRVPHVVQAGIPDAIDPTTVADKIGAARSFLIGRGINTVRGVYGAPTT